MDIFVAGVGTGGTVTGVGEYLKAQNPDIKIVAVESVSSAVLSTGIAGSHKIQGIGAGFVPDILNTSIYDEVITVENEGYIAMKTVAERQELSLKYIERIMPVLSKNHYVEGVQGKGGGYRLAREPKDYRVGDILRLAEGELVPVACLECNAKTCKRADTCKTLPMWKEFHHMVNHYFDNITLLDLMK